MNIAQVAMALTCVLAISAGQILFKIVGQNLHETASVLDLRVSGVALGAFLLYGLTTLLWIYLLRTAPLSRAYPFMAISFLLVPVFSVFLFGETVNHWYALGTAMIAGGVLIISLSG